MHLDKKNKKKLHANILKFIGGIILLSITFLYLQQSPAEKDSRSTGVKIMREKLTTSIKKIGQNNDSLYSYRQSIIAEFEELLYISKSTSCLSSEMKDEIENTYKKIKEENIQSFDIYKDNYVYMRVQYKEYIDKNCQKTSIINQ